VNINGTEEGTKQKDDDSHQEKGKQIFRLSGEPVIDHPDQHKKNQKVEAKPGHNTQQIKIGYDRFQ